MNLFTSNTPIGLGWDGFSVGVVFYLDLVIALTAEVDLQAGFTLQLPEDALLEAKLFGGDLTNLTFDGTTVNSLPITIWSGNATLTADLQLRAQVGVETDIKELGIGAGAELGIYANMVEFGVAVASSNDCALETEEWVNLNVGAYAEFDVEVAWMTIGVVPTVSTTLLAAPTWTQCWDGAIASGLEGMLHGAATSTSTASAIAAVTAAPSSTGRLVPSGGHASSVASHNFANSSAPAHAAAAGAQYNTSTSAIAIATATTTTYTITSCAASVANCPTSYQQTIIATGVVPARSSSSASPLAVLTPTMAPNLTVQATPVVQTFVPPSTLTIVAIKTVTAQAHYAPAVAASTVVSTATSPSAPVVTTTGAASSGCNALASTADLASLSPLEAAFGAFESALGIFEAAMEAEKTADSAGSSTACGLSVSTVTASFWQTQTMTVYQPTTVTAELVTMTVYAAPSTSA